MTEAELQERLTRLLREQMRPAPALETLRRDAELSQLGIDSLAIVDLVLAVEEAFGFRFPEDLLREATFRTVGSLSDALLPLLVAQSR